MDVRKMAKMGQRAMRNQQSKAEKAFWPLQAGRPREVKPTLLEAVNICQYTANKLYEAVKEQPGLNLKDAGCVMVCRTKDGEAERAGLFTPEDQDRCAVEMVNEIYRHEWQPIGVAFCLRDRDKNNLLTHYRAFEQSDESERLLSTVVTDWKKAHIVERSLRMGRQSFLTLG